MPTRLAFRLAEFAFALILGAALFASWRADRHEHAQLAAHLASAQQSLAQADARQRQRDTQLQQTLAALAAAKRAVTSPEQIVRELPRQIPLPAPIMLGPDNSSPTSAGNSDVKKVPGTISTGITQNPAHNPNQAQNKAKTHSIAAQTALFPAADLKPLYDFTVDCRACQATLATVQADLADEKAKTVALTRERDAAVRSAKGGGFLHRTARAAKWFVLGAAAGAIAATAHR